MDFLPLITFLKHIHTNLRCFITTNVKGGENIQKANKTKFIISLFLLSFTMLFFIISVSAADPVYVNTTGSDIDGDGSANNPFLTIQKGVSNITENGTIYIANGEYTGINNTNITINRNMALIGQSQVGTVINAQSLNQIFHIQNGASIVLLNLTLKNGTSDNGGGIFNEGSLMIIDCTFTGNTGGTDGAAINNYFPGTCIISGCTFNNNSANVAVENYDADLLVINSTFSNNSCGAIASTTYTGSLVITGSTFIDNCGSFGGAIFNHGNMTLSNSTFKNNSAFRGGAIYCWTFDLSTIMGCNFINNNGYYGGAIYNYRYSGTTFVRYNRFSGNTAEYRCSAIYDYLPGSSMPNSLIAECNWWGSNYGPAAGSVSEDVDCTPWLVLNVKADPAITATGSTSKITADVYKDSNGEDHSADALMFFSGPEVTFTTDLGNVGSKSITVPWSYGSASATLRADEGPGIATISAIDGQTMQTTVTILQPGSTANAVTKTIGMKETGIPINYLILAILAVISGLVTSKRK